MLIKLKELSGVEAHSLMAIYQESNKDNIPYFFPEVKDIIKGLQLVEESYLHWLRNDFLKKENAACYVWVEKGIWLSSLRLCKMNTNHYFLEALETNPNYRKKGHAEKLINSIIDELTVKGAVEI